MKLTYTGKRLRYKGMVQVFSHGKKEYCWGPHHVRFAILGHQYEAEEGPNGIRISREPKDLGMNPKVGDAKTSLWHAVQLSDEAKLSEVNAKKKIAKINGLNEKLEFLRPIIANMNFFEREALARYIVNRFIVKTSWKVIQAPKRKK